MATLTAEQFKKIADPILKSEAEASATSTKTIELGQTMAQVEAIFGKPESIAKLGDKTIYTYKTMKVIFMNGMVSDVQ